MTGGTDGQEQQFDWDGDGATASARVGESRYADLLVVGSRGYGGFASLLLGSVSQQCAHHAACPVVIVRNRGQTQVEWEAV